MSKKDVKHPRNSNSTYNIRLHNKTWINFWPTGHWHAYFEFQPRL